MTKKHYLATTGISEIWDFDSNIILLGPWCLKDAKIKEKNYPMLASPWEPRTKLKEAADYCKCVYEEVLPDASSSLNRIHNLSKPAIYWRILLSPWLMHFIGIVYDRQKRLDDAIRSFPGLYSSVLPIAKCGLWPYDAYDLISIKGRGVTDYYNLKLFSHIFNRLYPDRMMEVDLDVPPDNRTTRNSWRSSLGYYLNETKNMLFRGDVVLSDMHNIAPAQALRLEMGSSVVIKKFKPAAGAETVAYSEALRAGFDLGMPKDSFTSLLYALIPKAMPACYLEDYTEYAIKAGPVRSVKSVGSAVGWYFNEPFKFFAAEAAANGAKIIDFQHGGGYGTALSFPTETISMEKDRFYTWGWTNGGGRTSPLASPYLSKIHNSYKRRTEDVLFISNSTHKYFNRLLTYLTPHDMPKYFEDKNVFFQCLRMDIKERLLYRPYYEIGWNEVECIRKLMPAARILKCAKTVNWIRKSRVTVVDHQSTAIIEALAINVPSVFYWDHDVELIRPEAGKYFDMLRDAGILHRTPREAAGKVNEIYDNPMAWWMDAETQRVRDEFIRNFGLTSDNWREEWIEALDARR